MLTSVMSRGHKVALVTDGRMSGASGRVPAAIDVTPEAIDGGPIARLSLNSVGFWLTATGALLVNIWLVVGEFARTGWWHDF
jgi:phosphogluconate dehydratase